VKWDDLPLAEILIQNGEKKSKLDHGIRLYEVETALSLGIPYDWRWYSIDKRAREQMIASRLARTSIDNILIAHANRKV